MGYIIRPARIGAVWVDSDELFTDTALDALYAACARGILTYAEVLAANPAALARYVERTSSRPEGFQVSLLTYSRPNGWVPSAATGTQDATRALDVVHSLGVPTGLNLWDDVEGPSQAVSYTAIIEHVDAHALPISRAGDIPGPYIGWGTQLSSEEWYARPNDHAYWKAGGITRDRFAKAVEPARGWQFVQGLPFDQRVGPAVVDFDAAFQDQRGSRAMVIEASP